MGSWSIIPELAAQNLQKQRIDGIEKLAGKSPMAHAAPEELLPQAVHDLVHTSQFADGAREARQLFRDQ
jgi:hypothetical protein